MQHTTTPCNTRVGISHPVALALRRHASHLLRHQKGVVTGLAHEGGDQEGGEGATGQSTIEEVVGQGVICDMEGGGRIAVGSEVLMRSLPCVALVKGGGGGVDDPLREVDDTLQSTINKWELSGCTVVWVATLAGGEEGGSGRRGGGGVGHAEWSWRCVIVRVMCQGFGSKRARCVGHKASQSQMGCAASGGSGLNRLNPMCFP